MDKVQKFNSNEWTWSVVHGQYKEAPIPPFLIYNMLSDVLFKHKLRLCVQPRVWCIRSVCKHILMFLHGRHCIYCVRCSTALSVPLRLLNSLFSYSSCVRTCWPGSDLFPRNWLCLLAWCWSVLVSGVRLRHFFEYLVIYAKNCITHRTYTYHHATSRKMAVSRHDDMNVLIN
jgi:hypothetical protein